MDKGIDKTSKDYLIAEKNHRRYRRARDNGHKDFVEDAERCYKFYEGDQWNKEDKEKLDEAGRPALTINKVLSTVNTLLGEQSSRRASYQAKIRRGGTQELANVHSKVLLQVSETNDLDYKESDVFRDGVITGRGFFDVRMVFDGNINGEIDIQHRKNTEVILDPDADKYDPKTWKEVFTTAWLSLDEIEAQYGKEKAERVRMLANLGEYFTDDSIVFTSQRQGTFGGEQSEYDEVDPEEERDVRAVRVISRQYKKMKMVRFFIDPETGDTRPVPEGWNHKRIEFTKAMYALDEIQEPRTAIRWTTTVDSVVLSDTWSPYRTYTIVPYFCYWVDGRPFGIVKNLISPQEQLNKIKSQELHIVNSTANSGWVMEEDSLANMTADDLANRGSESGIVLEVKKSARTAPEKIKPNQIPTGLERISMNTQGDIKEISGITDAMLGLESAEVSGIALKNKENRGQVQIQAPLDNLARTRKLLGNKILELVKDFYTEERLMVVTKDDEIGNPQEELTVNQVTAEGRVLNDLTVGEYEVVVTTQPARDAFNDSQFAELLNMRQAGITIPGYRVVQASHLANKDDIARELQQLEGLGEQSPEQQQMAQMQMQFSMQQMQLELQKMGAEIQKLTADAQYSQARAVDTANSDEMEMRQIEADVAKAREGNDLRRDLSDRSNIAGMDRQVLQTRGRIAEKVADAKLNPDQSKQEPANGR